MLHGDDATLQKLRGRKVIVGGTALELGDRFSVPNGVILSGPVLQTLAAESLLQNRALQWTSHIVTLGGLGVLALVMLLTWRRLSAGKRVAMLAAMAVGIEAVAHLLQAKFPLILDTSLFHIAIFVYIAAIALDEIDIRDLLGRVAESRFQRVAMSLGDGLICTDSNYLITVWNPGATAIFGYLPEEMIGRPFDEICARDKLAPRLLSRQKRRRTHRPERWSSSTDAAAMARCFRSKPVSPAGRAPTGFSSARSCATSRYASAKPSEFDIWRSTIR